MKCRLLHPLRQFRSRELSGGFWCFQRSEPPILAVVFNRKWPLRLLIRARYRRLVLSASKTLTAGWRRGLRMLRASFNVFRPVAHVFVGVEDEVGRAGHVVFPFAFAHVVHGAVRLIRVVRDVAVLFLAGHGMS
ncbi:unnamed protein product, partial [Nesidiocoris tenuis]